MSITRTSRRGDTQTIRRRQRRGRGIIEPVLLAAVLVVIWWVTAAVLQSRVFPDPWESVQTLGEDLSHANYRMSIIASVRMLAISFAACVVLGTLLGIGLGLSQFWTQALLPLFYAANSVPKIVLYPIFLLLLGIGDVSRFAFAFVSGFLPMFLLVVEGTVSVSVLHLKLGASLRMGFPSLFRRILLPSLLPTVVTAMRISFGLTFLGLLLAEMFSGSSGLGFELLRNMTQVRMASIMGEVILIAGIALVPTLLITWAEQKVGTRFGLAQGS